MGLRGLKYHGYDLALRMPDGRECRGNAVPAHLNAETPYPPEWRRPPLPARA